jgi:hypothetical protein
MRSDAIVTRKDDCGYPKSGHCYSTMVNGDVQQFQRNEVLYCSELHSTVKDDAHIQK